MEKIIQQGAEAVIIRKDDLILKRRVAKGYRIKELDNSIRKKRTKREAGLLDKVREIINVPRVLRVSEENCEIDIEFISGLKLSEHLDNLKNWKEVCIKTGKVVAKLHNEDIIHGDLTTSNIILRDNEVYLIDFGLGFCNGRIEDKAVDLHLIKQALEAKHFSRLEKYFDAILEGYKTSKDYDKILKRFEKVEKRGRYR